MRLSVCGPTATSAYPEEGGVGLQESREPESTSSRGILVCGLLYLVLSS